MHANDSMAGTAFCISERDLSSVYHDYAHKEINLQIQHENCRLLFFLTGGKNKQRQEAFAYIVKKLGAGRIRQGRILPAELAFTALQKTNKKLVTAESCTGGLLTKLLTDIPGSSRVFWGGFIVYSDTAKQSLLGVSPKLIQSRGAVSKEVTTALAASALTKAGCDVSVAVSGIAGPDGGTRRKPVGTVWICIIEKKKTQICLKYQFSGSREQVRYKTATAVFLLIESLILGIDYLDYYSNW
ncbi:MAG: nicotinamide-nucleotide amidohydrolase family protein [Spirochaetales bacterium]|nr:nicotinamide-nucleotide amidohydrolase family protein [Spirochaetales bacterium]